MVDLTFIDETTTDYWYDVGCLESQRILAQFSEHEWGALVQAWPAQSEAWLERLAYIAGDSGTEREASLLLAIYCSAKNGAALAAAESIRAMPFAVVNRAATSLAAQRHIDQSALSHWVTTNDILEFFFQLRRLETSG